MKMMESEKSDSSSDDDNYRNSNILGLIKEEKWNKLLEFDELNR
jgi:hypothetical protein